MDSIYAFGINIIQFVQKNFQNYEEFLIQVNNISNPHYALTHIFPFISIFNLSLASQFILATSIADWTNAMLKWVLAEHRPYWWVRETHHYGPMRDDKPYLRLGPQTCETGPGSPSGHLMSASCVLFIFYSWLMLYLKSQNIRNVYKIIIKYAALLLISFMLIAIMTARLIIATHFPHQCLLGIILGILIAHFVSNYWFDLYMNSKFDDLTLYKAHVNKYYAYNILSSLLMISSSFALYWGQKLFGIDPLWSVKLAFKRCPSPDFLHFDSTPFYSLVESTGVIFGWSLCVTPRINKFNDASRSLLVAGAIVMVFHAIFAQWQETVSRDDAIVYYMIIFALFALRAVFFLTVAPFISTIGQKVVPHSAN